MTRGGLLEAVAKMPRKVAVKTQEKDSGPQYLVEDEGPVLEVLDSLQLALKELAAHAAAAPEPVSLLAWKRGRADLADASDDAWLMFACLQLRGSGFKVRFLKADDLDPYPINERFHDIAVHRDEPQAA